MVNFGLNSASILGIFLAVAGASLYFLRSVRPELAKDHDIFFAAVGLLCGFILLFQGWRLDPILQFGQFLLTGSAIFFAVESIRLRGIATEQARRNTPIVDRDRSVSRTRVYTEAELDKIDPYERYEGTPNYDSPRLRGYDEPQTRPSRRGSTMEDEPRSRNSRSRGERAERYSDYPEREAPRPSRRRPSSSSRSASYRDNPTADHWDDEPNYSAPRPRRSTREDRYDNYDNESSPRPPREDRYPDYVNTPQSPSVPRRSSDPLADLGRSYEDDLGDSYEDNDVIVTDYVDYQPLDNDVDDYDNYPDNEPGVRSENNRERGRGSETNRRPPIEDIPERNNPIDFDY